jgi:hypothetical protein
MQCECEAHPPLMQSDVLPTWMVRRSLCACAWTTATMCTFSTTLPAPEQSGPRHTDIIPGPLVCVCHGVSWDRAVCWGGLPWPVVNSLRDPVSLASYTTVAQRPRVQALPTLPDDGRPLRQRHAVSLAWTHCMPDHVSMRYALPQQRWDTAQVPLEWGVHLLAFSSPLSERKSDAVV